MISDYQARNACARQVMEANTAARNGDMAGVRYALAQARMILRLHLYERHYMSKPKTVAEQLDAAKTGEEFGQVLHGLFNACDLLAERDANG